MWRAGLGRRDRLLFHAYRELPRCSSGGVGGCGGGAGGGAPPFSPSRSEQQKELVFFFLEIEFVKLCLKLKLSTFLSR